MRKEKPKELEEEESRKFRVKLSYLGARQAVEEALLMGLTQEAQNELNLDKYFSWDDLIKEVLCQLILREQTERNEFVMRTKDKDE